MGIVSFNLYYVDTSCTMIVVDALCMMPLVQNHSIIIFHSSHNRNKKMKLLLQILLSTTLVVTCGFAQAPPSKTIEPKKILVVNMFGSKSMKNFYEPLVQSLANRGHQITSLTPFKSSPPNSNIKDIVGVDFSQDEFMQKKNFFKMRLEGTIMNPIMMAPMLERYCRHYYSMPEVKELLKEKFDLILASYTFNECGFGLVYKLGVPFILMHANVPFPWNNPTAIPYPLSFVPLPFFGLSDKMTFLQRAANFGLATVFGFVDSWYRVPMMERVYREFLGDDIPSANQIAANVSLLFSNSHFSVNYPRPVMPTLVEVGGMHCQPAKPLPKDLEDFANGAKDGLILFSMGSVLNSTKMPEDYRKLFVNVFAKLKQRVLWKWETGVMEGLPANVKLSKWLPQQDILGHKNTKIFITHGGLHSTEEAVYHGVPLIGIPMFGDQDANMKASETHGFAVTVEFKGLTEDKLLAAINTVLTDPKYFENAKSLSKRNRDRPVQPLDEAVYWVEYVMRYNGAPQLQSGAKDLYFFQYHSLDIIGFILFVLWVVKRIMWNLIIRRCLCRCFFRKSSKCEKVSPGKKNK